MKRAGLGIGTTVVVLVASLVLLQNLGAIDINWPWEDVDVLTDETAVAQPAEAEITGIEAIALDCRARIYATVPVEGKREHKVAGQVYRTDTVDITAQGDIDTCVDSSQVEIIEEDGQYRVLVPSDAITFERPRVDAEKTQNSVVFDKGFVGKITDAFPWVSDNSGLTPAAYSFAQNVIGSSECMRQAYDLTEQVLVDAYENQMTVDGLSKDDVSVRVIGEPAFGDDADTELGDFDFDVKSGEVACSVSPDAYGDIGEGEPSDLN